jgi:hypothetical protein
VVRNLVKAVFPGFGKGKQKGKGELFMETPEIYSKLVKKLAKTLPVIIFLFIVFACGFTAIILLFCNCKGLECNIFKLICFLASLPFIVFFICFVGFLCLMKQYYRFSVVKYEDNFLKRYKINMENVCLLVTKIMDLVKTIDSAKVIGIAKSTNFSLKNLFSKILKLLKNIPELLSKIFKKKN